MNAFPILTPEFLQLLIIVCLSTPFLIPVVKRAAKVIPMIQIAFVSVFLVSAFLNPDGLPLKAVFGGWGNRRGVEILFDHTSLLFIAAAYIVFLAVFVYALSGKKEWQYYFLMNLILSTLTALFVANDLFNIYVTLELLSLLSYLMISYENRSRQIWASLKYMILGAVGFNIFLIGTALVYAHTGTLNMTVLSSMKTDATLPFLMIFSALLIKSGVFFYSIPETRSESSTTISAILSGIIIKAGLFHIIRISSMLNSPLINTYLLWTGVISAVAGTLIMLTQRDIKLILAFSTMSQVGFILAGGKIFGAEYAFAHAIIKALLFLSAGTIIKHYGSRNIERIQTMKKRLSLNNSLPLLIGFFSTAGLPFFLGSLFKKQIVYNLNPVLNLLLSLVSLGTTIAVGKIVLSVHYSFSFERLTPRTLSITFLAMVSLITGVYRTLPNLAVMHPGESLLFFSVGIALSLFLKNRTKVFYPNLLFKTRHVLGIYYLILGLLAGLSVL